MIHHPFGSRFFSDLLHYLRSGDFVETLVAEARDVNELAFALGALAHYTSDTFGHRTAVNRVVPILYPKLRAEYGTEVLYAESPARHVMVEFAFDVLQAGRGRFSSDTYTALIGFEVATPLLERASSTVIPDITHGAWKEKQKDIQAATPQLVANALADKTFGELLKRFDKAKFAGLPSALHHAINAHDKGTTRTAERRVVSPR